MGKLVTFEVENLGEFKANARLNIRQEMRTELVYQDLLGDDGAMALQKAEKMEKQAHKEILQDILLSEYEEKTFDQLSAEQKDTVLAQVHDQYLFSPKPSAQIAHGIRYRLNALRYLAELQEALVIYPESFDPWNPDEIYDYEDIFRIYTAWTEAAGNDVKKKE